MVLCVTSQIMDSVDNGNKFYIIENKHILNKICSYFYFSSSDSLLKITFKICLFLLTFKICLFLLTVVFGALLRTLVLLNIIFNLDTLKYG